MSDVFGGIPAHLRCARQCCSGRESNPELNLMTLAPAARPGEAVEPFRFTGEAGSISESGSSILSHRHRHFRPVVAVAKIRKRRFFLRHTWVAGANFEYHAEPWPILRGRLIAGAAFVAYWFTGEINPRYAPWIALIIATLAPWLVVSSLRFNLGNTSHRNLRFRFEGGAKDGLRALGHCHSLRC